MSMVERLRQRLASGEEQARPGIGAKQVAAKIEDFSDGRIVIIATFINGVQSTGFSRKRLGVISIPAEAGTLNAVVRRQYAFQIVQHDNCRVVIESARYRLERLP